MLTGLTLVMAAAAGAQCDFTAATADSRYTATNVRAAPSSSAKILMRIGATDPVVVHVTGRRGDWYRVNRIDDAERDKSLFRGTAWIHRSQLLLSVAGGDHHLRSQPLGKSAALMRLTPDGNVLDIVDCQGKWVKVIVDKRKTGWIAPEAQCSNPMTTCS